MSEEPVLENKFLDTMVRIFRCALWLLIFLYFFGGIYSLLSGQGRLPAYGPRGKTSREVLGIEGRVSGVLDITLAMFGRHWMIKTRKKKTPE